ncbi:MAG: TAXI family TRAP transporter solute-binding subunit [Deltaproteobacteria bacterium]|nr:TAXI family TRAP transporter solute-binding subunit [Deltaproteobacteria bacterium]
MKEKKVLIIISALLAVLTINIGYAPAEKPESIILGSGPVGGGFNMISVGVAKYWKQDLGITANIVPGVVKANLVKFGDGKLDILLSAAGWYNAAYEGRQDMGFEKPSKSLRAMFHIYSNPYYMIALKKSGLRNISDLKDKRYGGGPNKAVWGILIGHKLEANGVKYFDNSKMSIAGFDDMARMLGDGTVDACVTMFEGLVPQPPAHQLMQEKELVALEWDSAVLEKFKNDIFGPAVIKKELLSFLEKDHHCWEGGTASFMVRDNVDEDLVYELTKSTHKNLQKLAEENPYWRYPVKYPDILTWDGGVPYHPGAIRYWKEAGLWKN